MKTVILREINDENIARAGEIIRNGGVVAFPTETVYRSYQEQTVQVPFYVPLSL